MIKVYLKEEHLILRWHLCFNMDYWPLKDDIVKWFKEEKILFSKSQEVFFKDYEVSWSEKVLDYITSKGYDFDISPITYAKPYLEFQNKDDAILFRLTWS